MLLIRQCGPHIEGIVVFISVSSLWVGTQILVCEQKTFFNICMCVCICAAVTEDLLAAVYVYYKQKHLTLQTRSLLLSFYSKLYLQEQGHTHIAR